MFTVTKTYRDLPAAHRQPNHDGHCRLIHGHNWNFDVVFQCRDLDENGFVVDVGKLHDVKSMLENFFDHTLLLNQDDPALEALRSGLGKQFAKVIVVPNCGMEALAQFVYVQVQGILAKSEQFRARGLNCVEVTCWEDSKNRATYK